MISMAKRGRIHAILATDADRIWRSQEALTIALRLLEEHGVFIVLVSMGLDTSTPMGRYIAQILVAGGEFESRMIGERVKRAHAVNRAAGKKGPGHRPYGYDVSPEGVLSSNADEQRTIDWVLASRAKGRKWSSIAGELNLMGKATVTGGKWTGEGARSVFMKAADRRGEDRPG